MLIMGMPKRVDANQKDIVSFFRKLGCSVQILSSVGKGCPDLLLGYRGKNYLIEVKNGALPPSSQKLTPHEAEFHEGWKGHVSIINSIDAANNFYREISYE
jgi:Holliday junction resolvase